MSACTHISFVQNVEPHTDLGCEDCLATGGRWVHLRTCLTCGHVGCCDSSPNRHAFHHAAGDGHPIAESFEPGEDWAWCFADQVLFEPSPSGKGARAHV
ncbi:UBP-type zinc finger domain-containing protein [Sphaerisporangium sp. NPDC051011]|uniref:UBP-type zinc finger domain-containing protein n=1 Tax=Sphaerisporangium sp. NPDC051011 TaxID=3155792 RepID=UPI0033C1196B